MRKADLEVEENGDQCSQVVSVGNGGEGIRRPPGTLGQLLERSCAEEKTLSK